MFSRPRNHNPYYGWTILFVGALAIFLSGPGQTYSVSTFIDPLMDHFGWSRSLISGLYSTGTLLAGLLMMLVGRTVDSIGFRIALTSVALLFSLALIFMSSISAPVSLLFGFIMIRTLGQGSLTLIPYSLIPQWFVRMRGKTLSLLAMAAAVSSATVPHINIFVMDRFGWRGAWQFWAVVMLVVLAPLAWKLTRDRPEDLGLLPDGDAVDVGDESSKDPPRPSSVESSWSLGEALGYAPFWVILLATSIPSMVGTGAQFHHMSILAEAGVGRTVAAAVFTVTAGVRLAVTPLFGVASDRWSARRMLILGLILQSVSVLFLLLVNSTATSVLLGVIKGIRMANVGVVNGVVWPAYFGRGNLATIRGVTTTGMVAASALGPLPFGLGFDIFGGYTEVILLMASLPLLGVVATWFLPPPRSAPSEDES
ncbi:MAG: MFS transporter [Bacillota bacterium]